MVKEVNKLIRDGKVAVLYSPNYGAGWFTWNDKYLEILFDPEIVNLVLEDGELNYRECRKPKFIKRVEELVNDKYDGCISVSYTHLRARDRTRSRMPSSA